MLVQRLKLAKDVLGFSNVQFAAFAGCSPTHISKIFSGKRDFRENGIGAEHFLQALAEYAEKNGKTAELCALCGLQEESFSSKGLYAWLCGEGSVGLPAFTEDSHANIERKYFGERFNLLMSELGMSNVKLSRLLSVDASLISRFRTGKRSPQKNEQFVHYLCEVLLENMRQLALTDKIARLLHCDAADLHSDKAVHILQQWLFDRVQVNKAKTRTMEYLNLFSPMQEEENEDLQGALMQRTQLEIADTYWGLDGVRNAILRLLTEAAREGGGEVYMYTDQSMQWLLEDQEILNLWYKCSAMCMRSNVHLTIIHDFNRKLDEVVNAMQVWVPLYMTGKVTPYYCTLNRGSRFSHMLFLRPGTAAITSWHGQGVTSNNFYNYIQDQRILNALHAEIKALIGSCEPLVQTYTQDDMQKYYNILAPAIAQSGKSLAMIPSPSSVTLPEDLLMQMLDRSDLAAEEKEIVLQLRQNVHKKMQTGAIYEMFELPPRERVESGELFLCFGSSLVYGGPVYTKEEFRTHIGAMIHLCETQPNYHCCIVPKTPFTGMRVIITDQRVVMIRLQKPYTAFVVESEFFTKAFAMLMYDYYEQNRVPVERTIEMLKKYLDD